MKIAFFDSGIGGLSVLKTALELLPNESYLYYADSNNAPYGKKTTEEVLELSLQAAHFLAKRNLKALVVACNTATSAAINTLRTTFDFPIIGMEPAVKLAIDKNPEGRVLVFATELTLREEKFIKLVERVDHNDKVDYLSLQELVQFAENRIFAPELIQPYLNQQFKGIDFSQYSSIVLGCTHFPFYKNHIQQIIPEHIEILDGNLGTVRQLQKKIEPNSLSIVGKVQYYVSGKRTRKTGFENLLNRL